MRAHWVKDLEVSDSYVLKGDDLHHLVNVIRLEAGEDLLLQNGQGLHVYTQVESISKRELRLKFVSQEVVARNYQFDLALGMPKREALELCLKEATELGFRNIYLIRSDYSQMRFPESERTEKLLLAALEQSNAPYLPRVIEAKWEEVPWSQYQAVTLLDSQTKKLTSESLLGRNSERLLVIGPEGGFSPRELALLHELENVCVVNLPTPILRTPTALATGAGLMMLSLLK